MTIWHLPAFDFTWPGHTDPLFTFPGFPVHAGQKIGLVGPNGAGKTTLLRQFQGTLLLVTHDAYLAEALAVEALCLSAQDAV